ncbi:MFS transporter [Paenibacillus physcomitrellae]|uniref:MFS transporter n=1 Tax=Paenibacillus physcomitrellae TaxID=1619311 RepID=A0ABQ1GXC7_9BACL|nr:MFS transporter [Paenibacillus physcomitrellae]GGA52202.1 MFS transporter [Paenibacillus physcomitrellae]
MNERAAQAAAPALSSASPATEAIPLSKNKDFLLLLCAKAISRFGDSVDAIAYSWIVYMLTGSKLLMGTLFAVNTLPAIVLSIFTGVFVDRWPKKIIVIAADYGRGTIVFLTGLLYLTGQLEVWHLFLFTLLISSLEAFTSPAENAWIPSILGKFQLLKGNSLSGSVAQSAELIGLAAAGGIIAFFGSTGALWVDAATFLLSGLLLGFVRSAHSTHSALPADEPIPSSPSVPDNRSTSSVTRQPSRARSAIKRYVSDLREGFAYVRGNLFIFTSILLAGIVNFGLAPINVLQTVYVKEHLHADAGMLSVLGVSLTCGMILSGLCLAKWGDHFRKSTLILTSFLLLGCSMALLSFPPMLHSQLAWGLAALLMALLGVSVSMASVPLRSYVMEVTPGAILGRISALISMVALSAMPLGATLSGFAADFIPVPMLYAAMGIMIVVVALCLLPNKAFRRI